MSPLARLAAGLIRGYQLIVSPWVTQQCKYYPSCSAYALEAVRTHGAIRGTRLAAWRLLRCNPWSRGGVDHVPGTQRAAAAFDDAEPIAPSQSMKPSSVDVTARPAGHLHPTQPART